MKGLITDRTQRDVHYRKELSTKGWGRMTLEEHAKWLGDPLSATGVNLFTYGTFYSSAVDLKYRSEEIVATALTSGIYLYAISIVGEAVNYENKTFTLSAEYIRASGNGTPQIVAYWHDDNGFEYAGASLLDTNTVTFNTAEWPNTEKRKYFALYVYVTSDASVEAGETAHFGGVMLENGSVKHTYVPYVEILPTRATKGAYNHSDLNRVERAVAEISDLVGLNLQTKTDWNMWDIPRVSDLQRYLSNIEKIRAIIPDSANVPFAPLTMNNLTYTDANNIELILEAAYKSITG